MASAFTLWNNQTFDVSNVTVTPGVPVVLASSTPINNAQTRLNSVNVELVYHAIVPDITNGTPQFTIGAIVEAQDANGGWQLIGYQYTPIRNSESASRRSIRIQPNFSDFNAGIDDSVFPIDREIARISRQQGKVPETAIRVCLLLVDYDPAGSNPFVSVTVSATGELFDA